MLRMIFILVLCLSTAQVFAQGPKAYIRSDGELIVNGKDYERSFWSMSYPDHNEFSDNPLAQQFYEKHRTNGKWASGLLWGGLFGALTYLTATPRDNYREGTYWAIFSAGAIGSLFCQIASQKNLIKAINIYNGTPEDQAKMNSSKMRIAFGEFSLPILSMSF